MGKMKKIQNFKGKKYRYNRILTYDICPIMIIFYHQGKTLISFWCKQDSNSKQQQKIYQLS